MVDMLHPITDEEELAKMRLINNPQNEPTGHYTGRCSNCGSKDLWSDYLAYGCNTCGAWLNGGDIPVDPKTGLRELPIVFIPEVIPQETVSSWIECELCGEYQIVHPGACAHCHATNEHLILRNDDDSEEQLSAKWRHRHGLANTPRQ